MKMQPFHWVSLGPAIGSALIVFGTTLQLFVTTAAFAQDCDQVTRDGGLAAVQAFLPSKIQIHGQCSELRNNETDVCSSSCNTAIEDFFQKNGGEQGRIFFTCSCADDSSIYPLEECDIDRDRLLACPALAFLISHGEITTTTTTDTPMDVMTKSTSTKEIPSTKPIIPPGKDCRRERIHCQSGIGCAKAFDYVKDYCLDDFTSGTECSKSCAMAVENIDSFGSSRDLWGCACDPDSDEITWCRMYGRNGLRERCVQYEVEKGIDKSTEEGKPDPKDEGIRNVANLLTIIVPSLLTVIFF